MSVQLNDHLRMVWNWGNFLHEDTSPSIVDTRTGDRLCVLQGHTDYVRGAHWFADDNTILTWSNDCSLRLWSLDGTCKAVFLGHTGYISEMLDLGDQRFASTSGDGSVRLWSRISGECVQCPDLGEPAPGDTPRLPHAVEGRFWVAFERRLMLLDSRSGAVIEARQVEAYSTEVMPYDADYCLLVNRDVIEVVRWQDGATLREFPESALWVRCLGLPDGRLLVAGSYPAQNRLSFRLWNVLSGELLGHVQLSGCEVLGLHLQEQASQALAQLKDYRCLTLGLEPLCLLETNGTRAYQRDGFRSFEPATATCAEGSGTELQVDWVEPSSQLSLPLVEDQGSESLDEAGVLADGSLAIRQGHNWKVFGPDLATHAEYSETDMLAEYPQYMGDLQRRLAVLGQEAALAQQAGEALGVSAQKVTSAMLELNLQQTAPNGFVAVEWALAQDGRVLGFAADTSSIWCLQDSGERFSISTDPAVFVRGGPLISPDGVLHRWTPAGAEPLLIDQQTIRIEPGYSDRLSRCVWNDRDHLLLREGGKVGVYSVVDGSLVAQLDSGHGMNHWGFRQLKGGPLVTWSRISLRSWSPVDYRPLVELLDPEDWGPGYEVVSGCGDLLAFSPGLYTFDHRIMLWDGGERLFVYAGHKEEIGALRRLSHDLMLSCSTTSRTCPQLQVWRIPL